MGDNKKKILIVDDSALMRRIICDILAVDDRFVVQDMAANGLEAIELLKSHSYDAMVMDIVMPKLNGIGVLREMNRLKMDIGVVVFSSEAREGADITLEALALGAFDFIHKPNSILGAKSEVFVKQFLRILEMAAAQKTRAGERQKKPVAHKRQTKSRTPFSGSQIVAVSSSTGGPKALQEVIPRLPSDLSAPVLVVQHMPAGFTASLAQRLDELSPLRVMEAQDGMEITAGNVYIAKGGMHMEVLSKGKKHYLVLKDGATREGVKPCANYMYESLADSCYDRVVCVVMTGMGADATAGIRNLNQKKEVYVIAQEKESCAVYGMPRSVVQSGLADQIEPLDKLAEAITTSMGVK